MSNNEQWKLMTRRHELISAITREPLNVYRYTVTGSMHIICICDTNEW